MHIFLQFRADSVVGAARVLRRTSVVMKRPNIPTIVYHNTVLVPLWNIRYICTCLKTLEELYHLIKGFQYPVFYHIFRIFLPAFRFINDSLFNYRCIDAQNAGFIAVLFQLSIRTENTQRVDLSYVTISVTLIGHLFIFLHLFIYIAQHRWHFACIIQDFSSFELFSKLSNCDIVCPLRVS